MANAPVFRPGRLSFELGGELTKLRPGFQILRVVERLVADGDDFDGVGFAEVFDLQLAAGLAIGPGEIGKGDVLADGGAVGH